MTPITDWQALLRARIYEQFKGLPNVTGIVDAFAAQVQALEDVCAQLVTLADIDASEGAQLDVIGLRVGEQRGGESDSVYRLRLRARIRATRSSGTASDLYAVMVALFGASATDAVFRQGGTAEGTLTIVSPALSDDEAEAAVRFARIAKAAGVRLIVEWAPVPVSQQFRFDAPPGLGFDEGVFVGAA